MKDSAAASIFSRLLFAPRLINFSWEPKSYDDVGKDIGRAIINT